MTVVDRLLRQKCFDLPVHGNKLDVASRLQANKKGGKSMLKKLITSARKDKPTKTIQKDAKAPVQRKKLETKVAKKDEDEDSDDEDDE